MPQLLYHLFRTSDQSGNGFDNEDLQATKSWRDENAIGEPIYDVSVYSRVHYDVLVNGSGSSFPEDEPAAIAWRNAHMPGVPITTHVENFEEEPYVLVQEE
jgi:hypothetical protein